MAPSAEPRVRWLARLDAVGLAATTLGTVLLLAYLIGSLIFTGAQLTPQQTPNYGQVYDWPVFWVPDWLSIAIAAIALLAFVPMTALARSAEAGRIARALSFTAAGALVQSLMMMWAFPIEVDSGLYGRTETVPGLHWIGAVLAGATIVLVLLLGHRAITEHDRRRRA